MAARRPTIAEVAAACGVSKASVSKALNIPGDACPVNADTRARIIATATAMGYRPGWIASSLHAGRTSTVALLYARPVLPTSGQNNDLFLSIHATLTRHRLDLVLTRADHPDGSFCEHLLRGRYDGILAFESVSEPVRAALLEAAIPAVLVNCAPDPVLPGIRPDDAAAARLAVDHLAGLGHRRIAYWHGHFIDAHPSTRVRAATVLARARELGIAAEELVSEADPIVRQTMGRNDHPTAIICFHENIALHLLHACWSNAMPVPGRLSILAFNDSYPGRFTAPPLTAVRLPVEAMGERAAEMLVEVIAGGKPGDVTMAGAEVIARHSTAAPG